MEGRSRSGRSPAVAEAKVTSETEGDELKGSGKGSVGFIDWIWLGVFASDVHL